MSPVIGVIVLLCGLLQLPLIIGGCERKVILFQSSQSKFRRYRDSVSRALPLYTDLLDAVFGIGRLARARISRVLVGMLAAVGVLSMGSLLGVQASTR